MNPPDSIAASIVRGIATSALAYVTDYYIVPRRFTPGFELCLPRRSFPWLYGALAVGLIAPNIHVPGRIKFAETKRDEKQT